MLQISEKLLLLKTEMHDTGLHRVGEAGGQKSEEDNFTKGLGLSVAAKVGKRVEVPVLRGDSRQDGNGLEKTRVLCYWWETITRAEFQPSAKDT